MHATNPKPTPHRLVKARRQRAKAKARKSCRAVRYAASGGCCEHCGRPLKLNVSEARHELEIANIHEIVSRARGGSAIDPFNTMTLCAKCHREAHS